jgi:hypothetical protein
VLKSNILPIEEFPSFVFLVVTSALQLDRTSKMRAPARTTQMEAAPGYPDERRTSSVSNICSTQRTPSPDHEVTETSLNPPIYDSVPPIEEKEGPAGESQRSTGRPSSVMPETRSFNNNTYFHGPQSPPENSNVLLEEPACDLLANRPAVWIIKGKRLKVSSLAASVLLNDGILTPKDLTL